MPPAPGRMQSWERYASHKSFYLNFIAIPSVLCLLSFQLCHSATVNSVYPSVIFFFPSVICPSVHLSSFIFHLFTLRLCDFATLFSPSIPSVRLSSFIFSSVFCPSVIFYLFVCLSVLCPLLSKKKRYAYIEQKQVSF